LFADFAQLSHLTEEQFGALLHQLRLNLGRFLQSTSHHDEGDADLLANEFFDSVSVLYDELKQDVTALLFKVPDLKIITLSVFD
jgi:serine O-acetyltransferase